MSNMKARAYIRLVMGPGIDYASLLYFGLCNAEDDCGFPVHFVYNEENYYVIGTSPEEVPMPKGTMEDILAQLEDHIGNTVLDEWLTPNGDFCVDEDNSLWVNEYIGDYHGQDITIHVHYLKVA